MSVPQSSAKIRLVCLCTSVGNEGFSAVYCGLKAFYGPAITIVGCDVRKDAYGLYLAEKGYLVPKRDDPSFLSKLLRIARQESCSAVYPLSTLDQEYFAANRGEFERHGLRVVVGDLSGISIANDKLKLYDLCRKAAIPIADYIPLNELSSLDPALTKLGYPERPVLFKRSRSTGARGLVLVQDNASIFESVHRASGPLRISSGELAQMLSHSMPDDGVLCEYLPGDEYSIDVLSWRGDSLVSVVRRRYSSFRGLALHAEVIGDDQLSQLAESVVRLLNLSYVSNVQLRRNSRGMPCLMEVNPRNPGTIGLTIQAGVNMPALALEMALGRELPDRFCVHYGWHIMRYWGGVYKQGRLLGDSNNG